MTMGQTETLSDLQQKVLDRVRLAGWDGCTCDEAEVSIGGTHQSISARFNELVAKGLIERRGARRRTRAGRMAFIYVAAGLVAASERKDHEG
jgi:predicted transcriptional regulator